MITAHERAMSKAYDEFEKSAELPHRDTLQDACQTYLQALLDDAQTVRAVGDSIASVDIVVGQYEIKH